MNENDTKPILFPIEMLNYDICLSCPEMKIDNEQMIYYSGDKKTYENRLHCAHYERCRHLIDNCSH